MDPIWIVLAVAAVIVLFAVVLRASRPKAPRPPALRPAEAAPLPLTTETTAEIERLLAAGNKIAAIKVFRDATGTGLADAKHRIDTWGPASSIPAAPASASAPVPGGPLRESLPAGVAAEIDGLVAAGRPIEAIKLLRTHTGFGLAESKKAIDRWTPGA